MHGPDHRTVIDSGPLARWNRTSASPIWRPICLPSAPLPGRSPSKRRLGTLKRHQDVATYPTWVAAGLGCPSYAIDDDTAIRVIDGAVDVVSEGRWRYFDR